MLANTVGSATTGERLPLCLKTAANSHNKLARREAKKQGRIERQYSPTPTESSLKRRFTRPQESAWQPYSDTARTLTSIADSLALKVPTIPEILLTMPSIFPYPSFLPPFSSSPSSAETQKPLSVSRTETPPGTFNLQHEVKDEEYLQDVESSVHLAALEEKDMGEGTVFCPLYILHPHVHDSQLNQSVELFRSRLLKCGMLFSHDKRGMSRKRLEFYR